MLIALAPTSRIKTVRAGEFDYPQDNLPLQASTEFRFETGLSIFYIVLCGVFPAIHLNSSELMPFHVLSSIRH